MSWEAPREIASGVFCLGPKGRAQTNVYLVRSEAGWVLVDAGWAGDLSRIATAAEALFGPGSPAAAILLTHAHPDHAGSARELARRWDSPVFVHPAELPLSSGDFAAMTRFAGPVDRWLVLPLMRALGRRRRDAILVRSSLAGVVRALDPAGSVPALPGWQWIHTPGHTPGHVAFFRPTDRVAITGDAIVTLRVNSPAGLLLGRQGLSGPPRYTSWSWPLVRESILALAALEPIVLAGGHGMPLSGPSTSDALHAFARGL
jgi:glyoxylase-like metal-dependent hydrolase (beta-lactamase superfamily II)